MDPMKEYKPPHYAKRKKERGFDDVSYIHVLGHFIAEYGYKETPTSKPKRLANPHRRAFLVQGRGLQGVIYIIDASGDRVAVITAITTPHDKWGPLPKECLHYYSASKRKAIYIVEKSKNHTTLITTLVDPRQ